jgi:hypothetical protein
MAADANISFARSAFQMSTEAKAPQLHLFPTRRSARQALSLPTEPAGAGRPLGRRSPVALGFRGKGVTARSFAFRPVTPFLDLHT